VNAARRLLDDLADAERVAIGEYRSPRGALLVTAPIMFGKLHVAPIVHAFIAAYPDVTVRLVLSDGVIDLVETHVDVAVRIGNLTDSGLIARRVGHVQWVAVASPDYIAQRGAPVAPADLVAHHCIAFEGLQTFRDWSFGAGATQQTISICPRFSVNTADSVVEAVCAGLGIARVMSYQAAAAVGDGKIVRILQSFSPVSVPVSLVHRAQRNQPLKQRAFFDFAAPLLKTGLDQVNRIML
jgi:DNA-binding transcriptional LysR family regulator